VENKHTKVGQKEPHSRSREPTIKFWNFVHFSEMVTATDFKVGVHVASASAKLGHRGQKACQVATF